MRQPASAKEASTSILAKQLGWDSSAIVEKQKHTRWIVQDFIAAGSVAWLYGAPGSYKTFAALDIAMSVATGKPWQGREVSQGAVLFIAAEGGDDIHIRRAAWVERHGVEGLLKITDNRPQIDSQKEDEYEGRQVFRYSGSGQLKEAIDVLNVSLDDVGHELQKSIDAGQRLAFAVEHERDLVERLKASPVPDAAEEAEERLREYQARLDGFESKQAELEQIVSLLSGPAAADAMVPKLVVIDTFAATCSDDTKDAVNRYTRNLYNAISRVIPCAAILVIDHTTKSGDTWMGSQAKLGNVDMMAEVSAKGDVATMSMAGGRGKIKAAPPFADIYLKMEKQELGATDAYGRTIASLVCTDGAKAKRLAKLAGGDTAAAIVLRLIDDAGGSTAREDLQEAFTGRDFNKGKKAETVTRTFRRSVTALIDDELVIESEEGTITMT
jgi:hypothetical protein